ncbi:hypothetical protein JHD49_07305 [Sulfurimonas sp. SAG-AH-194-C21]|nr:hypothetical protein [Sulfurimonas sp. SAG-AH-194-C21]MDF1883738.1 hypothetical protein [Sulfurimonas sp. SAG-AH-194-C21]
MMFHSLFLYQSNYQAIEERVEENSSIYTGFNYIEYLHKNTHTSLMKHINMQIVNHHINTLFILIDNCDSSLKVEELDSLKNKHQLKVIFFFMDSKNSFEYIDRYYAQMADLVILDETPFIGDFYKLLCIETFTLKHSFKIKNIKKRNFLSSSLINLSSETNVICRDVISAQHLQEQFKEIFTKLSSTFNNNIDLLLDNKHLYAQTIYEIYWNLYHFHKNHNLDIFHIKYLKYIIEIYKINKQISKNKADIMKINIIELLNRALYKKYTL